MKLVKQCLMFGLAMVIASAAMADETPKKAAKKGERGKAPSATQRFVAKLDLTSEQKQKAAEIDKQFADQVKELNKARTEILTPEQIKAERDAQKSAKDAGKSGPEARKAVEEAMKLTPEQKEKLKEWQKKQSELNAKVLDALKPILTPEQIEKLPKTGRGKGKSKKSDAGK
jgi:Spy/CpxP family protein refolding chaperone